VPGKTVGERPERTQVVEVGSVAGGEDDGVHHLACAVGPDDVLALQGREHRSSVRPPRFESRPIAAGVRDQGARDEPGEPFGRKVVEARPCNWSDSKRPEMPLFTR
jgi:hypothetical protein